LLVYKIMDMTVTFQNWCWIRFLKTGRIS